MNLGGYVDYIQCAIDGETLPDAPFPIRVREEPGSTAETLMAWGGSKTFARAGLTVFATEQEAREDAWRRIREEAAKWTEAKDSLPDEDSTRLAFTDGRRLYKGYYKGGQFFAETPPDAEDGSSITWTPEGITKWRRTEDN